MRFVGKHAARMAREFEHVIHADLRALLSSLNIWSQTRGLPELTVTQLVRYLDEQVATYTDYWQRLVRSLDSGAATLTREEQRIARAWVGKSPEEMAEAARKRFTWHMVGCAADIRTIHYQPHQLEQVVGWFHDHAHRPKWHWMVHDVHGPHLHVERVAPTWRQAYLVTRPTTTKGNGHG